MWVKQEIKGLQAHTPELRSIYFYKHYFNEETRIEQDLLRYIILSHFLAIRCQWPIITGRNLSVTWIRTGPLLLVVVVVKMKMETWMGLWVTRVGQGWGGGGSRYAEWRLIGSERAGKKLIGPRQWCKHGVRKRTWCKENASSRTPRKADMSDYRAFLLELCLSFINVSNSTHPDKLHITYKQSKLSVQFKLTVKSYWLQFYHVSIYHLLKTAIFRCYCYFNCSCHVKGWCQIKNIYIIYEPLIFNNSLMWILKWMLVDFCIGSKVFHKCVTLLAQYSVWLLYINVQQLVFYIYMCFTRYNNVL